MFLFESLFLAVATILMTHKAFTHNTTALIYFMLILSASLESQLPFPTDTLSLYWDNQDYFLLPNHI